MFACKICKYTTDVKCNYIKHLNTKKHKKRNEQLLENMVTNEKKSQNEPKRANTPIEMSQNEPKRAKILKFVTEPEKVNKTKSLKDDNSFYCRYCNKKFSTKANMRRHELHRCKVNKEQNLINELKVENSIMTEEHKEEKTNLYKHIEALLEKVGNTYNTTNHNTTNIILNNYGNEDISHLSEKIMSHLIKSPYGMIPKAIKYIHFNEHKPENQNICITNKKDKFIKVFKDNKWVYENKKETIEDIVDRNYSILDNHYEELGKVELNDVEEENYKSFQDKYDKNNKELKSKIHEDAELAILNNNLFTNN